MATAAPDGSVSFTFQKLALDDLLHADGGRHPEALVRWCFEQNKQ